MLDLQEFWLSPIGKKSIEKKKDTDITFFFYPCFQNQTNN